MDMLKKLCESLDTIFENMDTVLENKNDTVLTESQIDDEVAEGIDTYFEDVDVVISKWAPERREMFVEMVNDLLEESDPELMEERNIVRFDRNTVFNQLVGLFSLVISRRRKDPAFALYKKGSAIRRKAKNTIKAKYAQRAIPIARAYLKKTARKFR